jgi:hypothetical protein
MNRRLALLTLAAGPLGCGYLLHPERRGAQSGRIDGATMVMDLLWLLAGIIPGVVALIVDFSSGAIYVRGGSALRLEPGGRLAVRLPRSPNPARLELRLVTASNRIVARRLASIGPFSREGQSLELGVGDSTEPHEAVQLEIVTETGASARLPTSIEFSTKTDER